ncbi:MAG: MFS transporter [Candidatus Kerfeldbacteria bacterium]|nr:MFS transporter [Candidatus Kerfeldbacteria bacterium]
MIRQHLHFPHYFKIHLPVQLEELYLTAALMDFAGAAIALFEPIFLWTLGYGIRQIMMFYLLLYGVYFFVLPLGGKFVARYGPERSIMVSTVCLVGYFLALVGIQVYWWLFMVAPILFALQKTFYWPAYHFEFMRYSSKQERGREFSGIWAITTLMYVLGPVAGGFVVKFFGFTPLFVGAAAIILLSSLPLFATKNLPKPEAYSYWNSLRLPFRRRYLKSTFGYLGLGGELIGMTVWPIFIFLIYGDLFNLGLLVGAAALVTAVTTLVAGKWTDRTAKRRVLSISAISEAVTWLLRIFARFPPFVFVLDTLGRITHNSVFVSLTAMTYDRAHDDDYSWHGVYYEQGFALAKSLVAVLVITLSAAADPFNVAFLLAGLFSFMHLAF